MEQENKEDYSKMYEEVQIMEQEFRNKQRVLSAEDRENHRIENLKLNHKYKEVLRICPICRKEFNKVEFFGKMLSRKEVLDICSMKCMDTREESIKIRKRLRGRFNSKLKSLLKNPNLRTKDEYYDLIGCSIQEFKDYIEHFFKFDKDINWDTFGTYWEIDHIKPLENFVFTNENEQFEAFHFENCRAIPKEYNRFLGQKLCKGNLYHRPLNLGEPLDLLLFQVLNRWTKDALCIPVVIQAKDLWNKREEKKQEAIRKRQEYYDSYYDDMYENYYDD